MATLEWEGFDYFRHLACRIRNLGKEEEEIADVGLATESDWNSYSQQLQMSKKKTGIGARIGNLFRHFSRSKGLHVANNNDIDKASKIFQQKKYAQHHHAVHVSRLKEDQVLSLPISGPTYLESLSSKCTSIDPDIEVTHDKAYLDTLSDLKAKKSTWADYKTMIYRVKKEQLDEEEGKPKHAFTLTRVTNSPLSVSCVVVQFSRMKYQTSKT